MDMTSLEIAQAFLNSRLTSRMCDFPDQFPGRPMTETKGYEIQAAHLSLLQSHFGGGLSGYKAGFITRETRIQFGGIERLGIDTPTYGGILERFTFRELGRVPFRELLHPSVESEMVMRIGRDIPMSADGYDRESIAPYVDACMAGIELVDFHLPFSSFSAPLAPLMLADNACNWGVVIGPPVTSWRELDLANLRGELWHNGELIECGLGSALAGHPLNVLVGLESRLLKLGKTLRAGEIVMLGSVVRNFSINGPCEIRATWDALGTATAIFD